MAKSTIFAPTFSNNDSHIHYYGKVLHHRRLFGGTQHDTRGHKGDDRQVSYTFEYEL